MKYIVQWAIALLICAFSLSSIWLTAFQNYALQILGFSLSIMFSTIIYFNFREEQKDNKLFERLENILGIMIEKFKDKSEMDSYYVNSIEKAKRVEDLTWATFDHEGKGGAVPADYVKRIRNAAESGTDFDEIFIFNNQDEYRQDRLSKLNYHYLNAKKSKGKNQYSCYYFNVTNINFPRIQFTLIDESELVFTSGRNTRFRIKSEELINVFSTYFSEARNKAIKLIVNGQIVNEKDILNLLKEFKK